MRRSVLEPVVLSDDEREMLERWARRPSSAQALAFRCRVVLAARRGGRVPRSAELGVVPHGREVARRFRGWGWMGFMTSRVRASRALSATRTWSG